MGSREGALLKLARQHGLTLDELEQRRQTDSWCTRCKAWHPHSEFGKDGSRFNGLAASCRASRNACARAVYQPSARHRTNGRRYVQARDGDKLQARRRVNHLVDVGVIPAPGSQPCADCGHDGNDRRHEYDHHRGYAPEHHEDVEVVCSACHHLRERSRRG